MPVIYGDGAEPGGMGFATVRSWRAIKLHKRLFFGCSIPIFAIGVLAVFALPVKYQASATVEISSPGVDPLAPVGQPQADQFQDDDLPSTVAAMMQSRNLAQAVLTQLPPPARTPSPIEQLVCGKLPALCHRAPVDPLIRQQAAIDEFLKNLTVTPEMHSRILDVDVIASDAARAQALANAVVLNYQRLSVDQQAAQSGHVSGWLQSRTQDLQQRWLGAVQAADQFRKENNLPDAGAPGEIPLIDQQLADAAASLEAAQSQLINAQSAHRSGGTQAQSTPPQMSNANSQMLLQLETARDQLSGEFGPNYPKLKMLDLQIDALRRQPLVSSGGASVSSDGNESVATAQGRVDRLTARLNTLSRQDEAQGAQQAQYQILKAEADNAHSAYSTFVEHAAEVADRASLAQPAVTMVSEAGLPLHPSFPDRPKLLLGVLFLAVVAGAVAALTKQNLANVLSVAEQPGDEVPLLAALPFVPSRPDRRLLHHVLDEPFSPAAQAVRGIAHSLALVNGIPGNGKAVLVTSADAGEGRSTCAAWLATMIGQSGGKALLIHVEQQAGQHGMAPVPLGFSDLLFGNAKIEDVIRHDPLAKIDVIPGGSMPSLGLQRDDITRLHGIIAKLKQEYSAVILDSASLAAAPDGFMLSEATDLSLFICRWQHGSPAAVNAAIDRLRTQGAYVAGIVVSMKHARLSLAAEPDRGREKALTHGLYGA